MDAKWEWQIQQNCLSTAWQAKTQLGRERRGEERRGNGTAGKEKMGKEN